MKTGTLSDDLVPNVIRLLLDNPEAQQRTLDKALGMNLGYANNCLRILNGRE